MENSDNYCFIGSENVVDNHLDQKRLVWILLLTLNIWEFSKIVFFYSVKKNSKILIHPFSKVKLINKYIIEMEVKWIPIVGRNNAPVVEVYYSYVGLCHHFKDRYLLWKKNERKLYFVSNQVLNSWMIALSKINL